MKMKPSDVRIQCLLTAFLLALLGLHLLMHDAHAQNNPEQPPPGSGNEFERGGRRQQMREEIRRELREEMQRGFAERRGGAPEAGSMGVGPEGGGPGGRGPRGEEREPAGFLGERLGAGEGGVRGGRLGKYLEIVQSYQSAVQDSYQAVGLAALGLKEYYKRLGRPLDAVKELDEMLQLTTDQKMRNILLFAERQVYEEAHDEAKYIELNKVIMKENLAKTTVAPEKK